MTTTEHPDPTPYLLGLTPDALSVTQIRMYTHNMRPPRARLEDLMMSLCDPTQDPDPRTPLSTPAQRDVAEVLTYVASGLHTMLARPGDLEGWAALGQTREWVELLVRTVSERMPPEIVDRYHAAFLAGEAQLAQWYTWAQTYGKSAAVWASLYAGWCLCAHLLMLVPKLEDGDASNDIADLLRALGPQPGRAAHQS